MNQLIVNIVDENGKLEYDKSMLKDVFSRLGVLGKNGIGKQLLFSISRYSGKKSKEQLGYMFGGIVKYAAEHLHGGGYTEREMYSLIIDNCSRISFVNKKTGEMEMHTRTLSQCDKYETALLIDEAIRWLAGEGCDIESPEERRKRLQEL